MEIIRGWSLSPGVFLSLSHRFTYYRCFSCIPRWLPLFHTPRPHKVAPRTRKGKTEIFLTPKLLSYKGRKYLPRSLWENSFSVSHQSRLMGPPPVTMEGKTRQVGFWHFPSQSELLDILDIPGWTPGRAEEKELMGGQLLAAGSCWGENERGLKKYNGREPSYRIQTSFPWGTIGISCWWACPLGPPVTRGLEWRGWNPVSWRKWEWA